MRIIAVVNQKGGCGKTTTAINLSACLALEGRRVLLIDLDPQAHATLGLNVQPETVERGMYEVLNSDIALDDILISHSPKLWLAPCNVTLSAIEQILAGAPDRERRLQEKLSSLRSPIDYGIIDCPADHHGGDQRPHGRARYYFGIYPALLKGQGHTGAVGPARAAAGEDNRRLGF